MNGESVSERPDFAVLVPLAQAGDAASLNRLLLCFTPMIRAFKYNSYYVRYLEQDDTELLALIAVHDAIKSFRQTNFCLFTTHVKFTIRRRLGRQVEKKKSLLDCEQATLDDDTSGVLDDFSAELYKQGVSLEEQFGALTELVEQLPQMQRLVIFAVFWHGQSQSEVAKSLGISSQSVCCSKQAGLATLRKAYTAARMELN